jgi:hypothetical protein
MKTTIKAAGFAVAFSAVVSIGLQGLTFADDHERHERKGPRPPMVEHSSRPQQPMSTVPPGESMYAKSAMPAVTNPVYKEQCGACHFAYQPELLPSGSWRKILGKLDDHFGEVLPLAPEMVDEIAGFLEANAAERSSAKRAVKIVSSLGGATPLRITDVPYISHKHRKISTDVLRRRSIGSLANCIACHRTAVNGVYDDDSVSIPK